MAKSSKITLSGFPFASQKAAEDFVRNRLSKYSPEGAVTDPEDHALLLELVDRHPESDEKRGVGIAQFLIERNVSKPKTKAGEWVVQVRIIRFDGSDIDLSWKTCVRGFAASTRQNLLDAMRSAIQEDIDQFKKEQFKANPVCKICKGVLPDDFQEIHVDHEVMFIVLAEVFLATRTDRPATFDDCPTTNAAMFSSKDQAFAASWRQHHNQHATLRLTHSSCNMSRPRTWV